MPSAHSSPPALPSIQWDQVRFITIFLLAVLAVGGALFLALHVADVIVERRARVTDIEKGLSPSTVIVPPKPTATRPVQPKAIAAAAVLLAARAKISLKTIKRPLAPVSVVSFPSAASHKAQNGGIPSDHPSAPAAAPLKMPRRAHLAAPYAREESPIVRLAARPARRAHRPSPLRCVLTLAEPDPVDAPAAASLSLKRPCLAHLAAPHADDESAALRLAIRPARRAHRPSPLRCGVVFPQSEPEPAAIHDPGPTPVRPSASKHPAAAVTLADFVHAPAPTPVRPSASKHPAAAVTLADFVLPDYHTFEESDSEEEDEYDDDDDGPIEFNPNLMVKSIVDAWIPVRAGSREVRWGFKPPDRHAELVRNSGIISVNSVTGIVGTASPPPTPPPPLEKNTTASSSTASPPSPRPVLGDSRSTNLRRTPHIRVPAPALKAGVRRAGDHKRGRREDDKENEGPWAGTWIRRPAPALVRNLGVRDNSWISIVNTPFPPPTPPPPTPPPPLATAMASTTTSSLPTSPPPLRRQERSPRIPAPVATAMLGVPLSGRCAGDCEKGRRENDKENEGAGAWIRSPAPVHPTAPVAIKLGVPLRGRRAGDCEKGRRENDKEKEEREREREREEEEEEEEEEEKKKEKENAREGAWIRRTATAVPIPPPPLTKTQTTTTTTTPSRRPPSLKTRTLPVLADSHSSNLRRTPRVRAPVVKHPPPPASLAAATTTTTPSPSPPSPRPVLAHSQSSNLKRAPRVPAPVAKVGIPLRGSGTTHSWKEKEKGKENAGGGEGAWIRRRPAAVVLASYTYI